MPEYSVYTVCDDQVDAWIYNRAAPSGATQDGDYSLEGLRKHQPCCQWLNLYVLEMNSITASCMTGKNLFLQTNNNNKQ